MDSGGVLVSCKETLYINKIQIVLEQNASLQWSLNLLNNDRNYTNMILKYSKLLTK